MRWRRLAAPIAPVGGPSEEGHAPATLFDEYWEDVAVCAHCGGIHLTACPRVRRMRFHEDGSLAEVEFWEHWDESRTTFADREP